MSNTSEENPSTQAWRKLGFYYDFDQGSKTQCIFGDNNGIHRFINELLSYGNSKYFQLSGAHDHLGPYSYLELRTCECAGIKEGLIHGTPTDFLKLAKLIEEELLSQESTNKICINNFGSADSVPLVISVMPDGFDPSSFDRFA